MLKTQGEGLEIKADKLIHVRIQKDPQNISFMMNS
jgi:hypothetical protein